MSGDQLSMFAGGAATPEAAAGPVSFTISRTINGSQQRVCDHWLMPVFVGEWMFGPRVQAEKVIRLDNSVRKHGEFDYRVRRRGQEISHTGEYLELNIPSKLTFNWKESSYPGTEYQVSVRFIAAHGKTRLKLNIRLPADLSSSKDKIKKVWTNRCKALAEKFR